MKKAFTIVEMLVVVGIIAVLMAALMVAFSGAGEAARATKCLSNLKNIATACQNYGMNVGYFPLAGSGEGVTAGFSNGSIKKSYCECKGWISWYSNGAYGGKTKPSASVANGSFFMSSYNQEDRARLYCYTNGTLYKYISGATDIYVCPSHRAKCKGAPPAWSYVMNSRFGFDPTKGSGTPFPGAPVGQIKYTSLPRADRVLLFAEMPFAGVESKPKFGTSSGIENDPTLQYGDNDGKESIAFNHISGKEKVAHIVFADGHIEQFVWPRKWKVGGVEQKKAQELTKLLCTGKDIMFNGNKFEELD